MSVSFGLVSVPVLVSPATEEHRVRLHEVHRMDGGRIRHRRVCELEGQEVACQDVARGVEMPDGTMAGHDADLERLPDVAAASANQRSLPGIFPTDPSSFISLRLLVRRCVG